MKFYLSFSIFIIPLFLYSQKADKNKIPAKTLQDIPALTAYLTANLDTEDKKVAALYSWVVKNIAYDIKKLEGDKCLRFEGSKEVLKNKKATCSGYVYLLGAMLDEVNVKWEPVSGYTNVPTPYYKSEYPLDNHAWIAIRVNSIWHLADPTWDAGYVGAIPIKDKRPSLEKQLAKIDKINLKNEALLKKGKEATEVPELDTAKKVTYGNKIGFVRTGTTEWFLIEPDSFHLRHLPANPMWQQRKPELLLSDFLWGEDSIREFYAANPSTAYRDNEIDAFHSAEFLDKVLKEGDKGYQFYPKNPRTKLTQYHQFLEILNIPEVKKNFKGLPEKYTRALYKKMNSVSDTTLIFVKLGEAMEKNRHKEYLAVANKAFRKAGTQNKKLITYVGKGIGWNQKGISNVEKSDLKLETEYQKLHGQVGEFPNKPRRDYSALSMKPVEEISLAVKYLTDSIDLLEGFWEKAITENALQRIKDYSNYNEYLLSQREDILRQRNLTLYIYVEIIDSIVSENLVKIDQLYKDSLSLENFPQGINKAFAALAKYNKKIPAMLQDKMLNKVLDNPKDYEAYFEQLISIYYEKVMVLNQKAIEYNTWLKKNLKLTDGLWAVLDDMASEQEGLLKSKHEYLLEQEEHSNKREQDMYKVITEQTKKWKTEIQGKF